MTAPRQRKIEMPDGTFFAGTAREAARILNISRHTADHCLRKHGTLKGVLHRYGSNARPPANTTAPTAVTLPDAPAIPGAQADRTAATAPRGSTMIGEAVPRAAKPDCPRMAAVVATIRECRDAYLAEALA